MTGSTNDRWENGPGCIIAGKAGLAHTGAVVDNQSGNLVVRHRSKTVASELQKIEKLYIAKRRTNTIKYRDF